MKVADQSTDGGFEVPGKIWAPKRGGVLKKSVARCCSASSCLLRVRRAARPHAHTLALTGGAPCHRSCLGERLGWLLWRNCMRHRRNSTRLLRLQHD